jgi:hypothetical protein
MTSPIPVSDALMTMQGAGWTYKGSRRCVWGHRVYMFVDTDGHERSLSMYGLRRAALVVVTRSAMRSMWNADQGDTHDKQA